MINAYSQNYLINFTGYGVTNVVNNVQVQNLTQNTTITLNGNDILQLGSLGINDIADKKGIMIYPNPMTNEAEISFFIKVSGEVDLTINDISGKIVLISHNILKQGWHKYKIGGLNKGIYFINIKGIDFIYTNKIISINSIDEHPFIEHKNDITASNQKSTSSTIFMSYSIGDRLLFKGISGNYSTIITDIPNSNKTISFNFISCTDADNNNYPIVQIANQFWMAENLKTTKYNNGNTIGTTNPINKDISNELSPKYQWLYNDNQSNIEYGRLYTWYAVTDNRNVCPIGWHLPSSNELDNLAGNIGGVLTAGKKLKEVGIFHWMGSNLESTNEYGFTALPGGIRFFDGSFNTIMFYGEWWSSTTDPDYINYAYGRSISYNQNNLLNNSMDKKYGRSVRCLKD
jgi:uncharacterized protein (TIGR02145 family)